MSEIRLCNVLAYLVETTALRTVLPYLYVLHIRSRISEPLLRRRLIHYHRSTSKRIIYDRTMVQDARVLTRHLSIKVPS